MKGKKTFERVAGVEPALSVWKTDVLPIYDTRNNIINKSIPEILFFSTQKIILIDPV